MTSLQERIQKIKLIHKSQMIMIKHKQLTMKHTNLRIKHFNWRNTTAKHVNRFTKNIIVVLTYLKRDELLKTLVLEKYCRILWMDMVHEIEVAAITIVPQYFSFRLKRWERNDWVHQFVESQLMDNTRLIYIQDVSKIDVVQLPIA